MDKLDLRGKTCPVPVIETKKLIDSKPVKEIEVLVDNLAASENVQRFLVTNGFTVQCKEEGDEYRISGMKTSGETCASGDTGKVLVYINSETIGRGSDELGGILMKAFLATLKEIRPAPWRLIFINSGVKIVSRESQYVQTLKDLESAGVEILSCGTCLDYFNLKEKTGAGRISNMFEIISSMTEASQIIKP